MVSSPVYIVDIIGKIVADFTPALLPVIKANEQAALGKTMIDTINYQYGHTKELIQTLAQDDKSAQLKGLKYPLVYLVQDFPEKRGQTVGVYAKAVLDIILIHQTLDTYKITDRYRNVFKPVLYPIYYALMQGIADCDVVNENSPDIIMHTKVDRSYWGRVGIGGNEANTLNDFVDAIEVGNLSVTILYNNC